MWFSLWLVFTLIFSANGIRVPVDNNDERESDTDPTKSTNDPVDRSDPTRITPVYYISDDDSNVDSYLLPPSPHRPDQPLPDVIVTPATYLLPPSPETQVDYLYNPTETGRQTDWYPISQTPHVQIPQHEQIPIYINLNNQSDLFPVLQKLRRPKVHDQNVVRVPSTELEPPAIDAPNDYIVPTTTAELITNPIISTKRPINTHHKHLNYEHPTVGPKKENPNFQKNAEQTLTLHLLPPQPEFTNPKIPTKLYPKKFGGEFKPVPIPIAQYADESASEIPRARPVKLFKPLPSTETDYSPPSDEKINYLYRKAEHKRKLKGEEIIQEPPSDILIEDKHRAKASEQDASETHYRHPGRNVYPAPLRQVAPTPVVQQNGNSAPAPDERTEFRMHGMKGPHSYQFGFDTGKGKNRQFRYEERDNEGAVKGHYGYMDKHGKLRVVNYSADPKTGFRADAPVEKER